MEPMKLATILSWRLKNSRAKLFKSIYICNAILKKKRPNNIFYVDDFIRTNKIIYSDSLAYELDRLASIKLVKEYVEINKSGNKCYFYSLAKPWKFGFCEWIETEKKIYQDWMKEDVEVIRISSLLLYNLIECNMKIETSLNAFNFNKDDVNVKKSINKIKKYIKE